MESIVKLDDITIKEWENGVIEFEVTDENNNPISGDAAVKLNDSTFLKGKVVNGKFSEKCSFQEIHNESYDIEGVFDGNEECNASRAYAKLYVKKIDPIIISFHDLQNAGYRLVKWININKRLPGKISINNHQISIGHLLYIFSDAVINLNNNITDDLELTGIATPRVSSENLKCNVIVSKEEIVEISEAIIVYSKENNELPSTIETSKGKIGFMNLLYTLAVVIANSSSTGLLNNVNVRPWKEIVAK